MDLFNSAAEKNKKQKVSDQSYTAKDIEVLEGLEPVRRRPGMYIGGTDRQAMHHLVTEVLDNSMDEAVAGHASQIQIHLAANSMVTISDNGRGIPVDPHPKFPKQSALEVILTTLHSGGKFSDEIYATSGGLHGVGVSVVNALSDHFAVEVLRNSNRYKQLYCKGVPQSELSSESTQKNLRGTTITFHPDPEIFGNIEFDAEQIYRLACSRAYLYRGVKIIWSCDEALISDKVPKSSTIHYPNGLKDYLDASIGSEQVISVEAFVGESELGDGLGRVEWAMNWITYGDAFTRSYCNTIHTLLGGTHETGIKNAILKGIKNYANIIDNKKALQITLEDVLASSATIVSLFIKNPIFQGQTKEKLLNQEASKLVENAIRHQFEHWLAASPKNADNILSKIISDAEERINRKKAKEVIRKSPIKSLRLPGKLSDCNQEANQGTEIFLVEGESAGGSAKQARNRETQAILPLKGKILNVASNSMDKIKANQEISDLITALGCGVGEKYKEDDLRYEKIIIMTDADVDGSHIASLLLTFFYLQMPNLIRGGHLYLAQPPLYKIAQGAQSYYVRDDLEKEKLIKKLQTSRNKFEVSRFKGLGEMSAPQLKDTTMDPKKRILLKVIIDENEEGKIASLVENLMGRNPEPRFRFIQERTNLMKDSLGKIIDI